MVPRAADVELYRRELAGGRAPAGRAVRPSLGCSRRSRAAGRARARDRAVARERLLAVAAQRGSAGTPRRADARLQPSAQAFVAELASGRVAARCAGARAGGRARRAGARARRALRRLPPTAERHGSVDAEQRAATRWTRCAAAPAWGATPVVLYGFDDLEPLQLDVIETLGATVGAPVTVSLPVDPAASRSRAGPPSSRRSAGGGRAVTSRRSRPTTGPCARRSPPRALPVRGEPGARSSARRRGAAGGRRRARRARDRAEVGAADREGWRPGHRDRAAGATVAGRAARRTARPRGIPFP